MTDTRPAEIARRRPRLDCTPIRIRRHWLPCPNPNSAIRSLKRVLGSPPDTGPHLFNSYGPETLKILHDLGVKVSFIDNLNVPPGASLLELPRQDHLTRQIQRDHDACGEAEYQT